MTVSLCVATRGRPELLFQSLTRTLAASTLDKTRIVLAIDEDDIATASMQLPDSPKIIRSVKPREDSLGEKYNRCQRAHRADLYVVGCDDSVIPTPGWDEILLAAVPMFSDGIGVIYFGEITGVFQPGCAITHGFVERMGYFMQPYTPYWFHDTWVDEIAHMIGRVVTTKSVDIEAIGPVKESRGAREIEFWARFFDETRPLRRQIAEKILAERLDRLTVHFRGRNSVLRDPQRAKELEAIYGFDAPEDERYLRIKRSASLIAA